ncbi:hypothetical protein B0T25DRAFT_148460 [Lasiosphaeria hispida]|uniref:Secreted protein n=1 Tax=Lasiosphaeria hispida TaxID=260671 RepID=A0AAJ0HM52_9PEZI|nr:hypothetical protein B0T25DRAFT_148460 [Lasiosphaeria hispida]
MGFPSDLAVVLLLFLGPRNTAVADEIQQKHDEQSERQSRTLLALGFGHWPFLKKKENVKVWACGMPARSSKVSLNKGGEGLQ